MSKSAGTESCKDVVAAAAAAAARITSENQVVCNFDYNPEENSDLLLFWIMTTREQIITNFTK